jgi:hypothetical protein
MPFESRSLYDTLSKAALPSAEEASLLHIPATTPLLAIESLAWSKAGDPIAFYYGVYCSAQAGCTSASKTGDVTATPRSPSTTASAMRPAHPA